jgi:hypothetical protein
MMSPRTADFQSVSQEVAARFLHTVVLFDDQAFINHTALQLKPKKLKKPTRQDVQANSSNEDSAVATTGPQHELDAKTLIDLFAEKGLVCSVLVPGKGENSIPKTVPAARRSDIVVLDWRIHDDNGDITTNLIGEILRDDGTGERRLRMIAIYTAEPDLYEVLAKLKNELKNHYPGFSTKEGDFTLTKGPVHIAIFAKEGSTFSLGDRALQKRIVRLRDLPKHLISEFSVVTRSLIGNVALESLAAVRANTHQILMKFRPELDAAYLTHRALLVPPEEAELHLIPLVLSEIQAVLEDRNVSRQVSLENITKWLDFRVADGLKLHRKLQMKTKSNARKAMLEITEKGVSDKTLPDSYPQIRELLNRLREETHKSALNDFTKLLIADGTSALEYDRELALLMSVRSRYESPTPMLMLGTIIAELTEGEQAKYWLCVQPVCDSLRLKNKRSFPFLKMSRSQSDYPFNYVVREGSSWVELNLQLRPHQSRLVSFKPKANEQEIRAVKEAEEWYFESDDPTSKKDPAPKKYRWIADLKTEHAQRVANDYSTQISRVGLMESEWLRRWAKK